MKSIAFAFASAFNIVTLGCCTQPAAAQTDAAAATAATPSAAPPTTAPAADATEGALSRFGGWFTGWGSGWETGSHWRVMYSPYTYHYTYDPLHAYVYMWGLERQRADGFVFGGSAFRNSFGQPSVYAYVGQRFEKLAGVEPLFVQLTGGLLYGYKEPYENKVPLNHNGFSPGAVVSLGWQFTPVLSAQLNFLGTAALMFQISADLR